MDRYNVRVYAWAYTDDAFSKPTRLWNEIYCAHDNIYRALILLVGRPGNEASPIFPKEL